MDLCNNFKNNTLVFPRFSDIYAFSLSHANSSKKLDFFQATPGLIFMGGMRDELWHVDFYSTDDFKNV